MSNTTLFVLAQIDEVAPMDQLTQVEEGGGILGLIIPLALLVIIIAGNWKVFVKAGLPGWGILIPIYNTILWLRVAGRPAWWFFLLLIPLVNFVIYIIASYDVATKFGKGVGFTIGLIVFPFIFYPILGFGSAEYHPTLARLREQAVSM